MSGLILTERKQGAGFCVKNSDMVLTSMAELCYYIYHNIYALDAGFFDEDFFDFLKAMEQDALIQKLNIDILSGRHYTVFAEDVILYTDYYSTEEKKRISREFQKIKNRTPAENEKARADLLYHQGRTGEALREYQLLLQLPPEKTEDEITADTWNNIGVIKVKAFHYKKALLCFEKAADTAAKEEYLDNLICTLLLLKENENEAEAGEAERIKREYMQKYQITQEVMDRYAAVITQETQRIEMEEETKIFRQMVSAEGQTDLTEYYRNTGKVIDGWKEEYREQETERQSE
ncbi:putative uncharacterized protein [Roseburia sp. CAG:303]|nr:putative uncharacterized protein [Roseburia sp. CAG:303]